MSGIVSGEVFGALEDTSLMRMRMSKVAGIVVLCVRGDVRFLVLR
jgi:hypothetical protein